MRKFIMMFAILGLFSAPAMSQSLLDRLAVGVGGNFGEEADAFSRGSLFYSLQLDGYDFQVPAVQSVSSGLAMEVSFPGEAGPVYQFFSLNRTDVPGIPGMYGGVDFKFGTSNEINRYSWDYDERIVVGYRLGSVGPGSLSLEVFSIEENTPIRWGFVYDF